MFNRLVTRCASSLLYVTIATVICHSQASANPHNSTEGRSEDMVGSPASNLLPGEPTNIHFFSDLNPLSESSASDLFAQASDTSIEESETGERRGFYLSASGAFQGRLRATETNAEDTFSDFNSGFSASAAVGYRFDSFRLEGEFTYFNNSFLQTSAPIPPEIAIVPTPSDGDVGLYAFMANAYYDIPTNSRFRPYVGAGLGFYISQINNLTSTFFPAVGLNPVSSTSNPSFAFQLKLGVSYEVNPSSEFFVGYRYFQGSVLQFSDPGNFGDFAPDGARIHAAELGFRYFF